MKARSTSEVDEFLDACGAMLLEHPARNQLILGILGAVRSQPDLYESYQTWWVEEEGTPVAAASMTSPWNLVLADAFSHWAVPHLVEAVASADVNVPGVVGNRPTVDRFVEGWRETKGCHSEVLVEQGLQFVYLYTDLANATSNDIYRRIGYEQVADSAQVEFDYSD